MAINQNVYDEIAHAAYELYEKRGKANGHNLEDWLEAEKIVMKRHAPEIAGEAKVIKSAGKVKTATTPKATPKTGPKTKTTPKTTPKTKKQ